MEDLIQQIGLPIIAVLVPLLIAGLKSVLPKIPTAFLPVIAAVMGPILDVAIAFVTGLPLTGVMSVLAGLAGVGLREVKDQATKAIAEHKAAT